MNLKRAVMFGLPKFPYSNQNIVDALKELLSVLLLGFLPITLGLLFAWLLPSGSVVQFVLAFLGSGEALLLSTALVGPLIYILAKNHGKFPNFSDLIRNNDNNSLKASIQFPYGWFFIVSIFLICVIAASVFGYNAAVSENEKFLSGNMQKLSAIIILLSLTIFFLISIVRNNLLDGAAKIMSDDTSEFLSEWDEK